MTHATTRTHGRWPGAIAAAVLLTAALALPAVGWADGDAAVELTPDTEVSIDLNDAALADVVVYVSHLTGENFVLMESSLYDERLTVYGPTPMKVSEVDDFLRSVLVARGFHVERRDGYWAVARAD